MVVHLLIYLMPVISADTKLSDVHLSESDTLKAQR